MMKNYDASPLTLYDAERYAIRRAVETGTPWGVYVGLYGTIYACREEDAPVNAKKHAVTKDGGICYNEQTQDGRS